MGRPEQAQASWRAAYELLRGIGSPRVDQVRALLAKSEAAASAPTAADG